MTDQCSVYYVESHERLSLIRVLYREYYVNIKLRML